MIHFNYFRTFYYVAKHLSFTLAARDLLISQPAVTKQIKTLEDLWNIKLFGKKGRRIYLTEEGKTLFTYAKKMFDFEVEIEHAVEEIQTLKRGVLRIATPQTYKFLLSFIVEHFHKRFPHIRIQIHEGSSWDLTHKLQNYDVEIAIIAKVGDFPEIQFIHFSREEVFFVVGPNHALAKEDHILFEDLSDIPINLSGAGSGSRKVVLDFFARHHCTPKIFIETDNMEFTKQLVHRGDACAFLTEASSSQEIQDGSLIKVPIKGHQIFFEIYVAFLKDHILSLPAEKFLEILGKLDYPSKVFPYLVPSWPKNFPFKSAQE